MLGYGEKGEVVDVVDLTDLKRVSWNGVRLWCGVEWCDACAYVDLFLWSVMCSVVWWWCGVRASVELFVCLRRSIRVYSVWYVVC